MKLTKISIPLLAGTFSIVAHAQSSVSLYGSIDEGVSYATNAAGSQKVFVGPESVPDYFGLRGTEDLGGNLKALFALEQGYSSANGTANVAGDAFSYFSYVGLGGDFGTVTLGRQLDLTTETLMPASNNGIELMGFTVHPGNLDGIAILGSSINNSFKYKSPDFYGLSGAVLYGLADATQPGRELGADLVYNKGPLNASAVYSSWRNHTVALGTTLGYTNFLGESLNGAASVLLTKQDIFGLSAIYQVSQSVIVHGLVTQVNLATPTTSGRMRSVDFGVNWYTAPANAVTVGSFVSWLNATRYAQAAVGDRYSLSKATQVYVQAAYEHATGNYHASETILNTPSSGPNQALLRIGIHHSF
ncbi:porin [Pararobbsia silviterrae]|uniref:Porin n=1 Tax=Pararobbsia silviterrae TaxID=1792498 RepID=A0A494XT10_9BURK|nr:porin [Pararobbsia silviterrae]RKP53760.1 porin [Pararobbsia silviterrae]